MNTQTIDIKKAKDCLHSLLEQVASGDEVIISTRGKPFARITRIDNKPPKIRFGVLKGKVEISDDFDAPLPDDVLQSFEENECGF